MLRQRYYERSETFNVHYAVRRPIPREWRSIAGRDLSVCREWSVAGSILVHGMAAGRKIMWPAARELAQRGLVMLVYDLRGHGDSEGVYAGEGADDLVIAYRWFRERFMVIPERIGIVGHSLGGRIALIATAQEPAVAATVALSPAPDGPSDDAPNPQRRRFERDLAPRIYLYPGMCLPGTNSFRSWRWNWQMRLNGYRLRVDWAHTLDSWNALPIMEAVKIRAAKPLLLMQGRLDHLVACEYTKALYQAARPPKELWVIPIGLHGTPYRALMRSSWINWLHKHLSAIESDSAP